MSTPVSSIGLLPTLRDLAGLPTDPQLPGRSLRGEPAEVPVFAEYHAQGMITGGFMLRSGHYKLCTNPNQPPQLFDCENDPNEVVDLAADPDHAEILARLQAELAAIAAIDDVDRRARADQAERTAAAARR